MKRLEKFEKYNIPISWTGLILGWKGFKKTLQLISIEEIIQYSIKLCLNNENQTDEVFKIAGMNASNYYELEESLFYLSKNEEVDELIEEEKWIVILLIELMENLSGDFIEGLTELTNFWEKFNYPEFSPHIVQGRKETANVEKYYSEMNYLVMLERHQKWINDELQKFIIS